MCMQSENELHNHKKKHSHDVSNNNQSTYNAKNSPENAHSIRPQPFLTTYHPNTLSRPFGHFSKSLLDPEDKPRHPRLAETMYMSFSNPPLVPIPPFELLSRQDDAAEPIFKLYHYDPTIAGAVIFVILFLGTTCFHTYQLWRARTWFMVPLVLGGVCKSPHEVLAERLQCNTANLSIPRQNARC